MKTLLLCIMVFLLVITYAYSQPARSPGTSITRGPGGTVSGTLTIQGTLSVSGTLAGGTGMILHANYTSDPCDSSRESGIFYNATKKVLCFCDGTNDLEVNDGTACF